MCVLIRLIRSHTLTSSLTGAFQLYDINKDGNITYQEMLQIVQAIYKMTGQMLKLPENEETPEKVFPSLRFFRDMR
jgi:Ca2+-binding EF-hand superfamily protein